MYLDNIATSVLVSEQQCGKLHSLMQEAVSAQSYVKHLLKRRLIRVRLSSADACFSIVTLCVLE
jgi:hypothetical protein